MVSYAGEEPKMRQSLIVWDPEILNGKPIIKGTRLSVALILQVFCLWYDKRGHPPGLSDCNAGRD